MSVGTKFPTDDESFASAGTVFPLAPFKINSGDRCRSEIGDSSVAMVISAFSQPLSLEALSFWERSLRMTE